MQGRNLVLIGFMGVGKSTIGRQCARRLGYTFQDSDAVISERVGGTVAQFFAEKGEAAFRALEREIIAELAATPNLVIATGGGAALDPENIARLQENGLIVLLTATPDIILRRVGDARTRPLLAAAPNPRVRVLEMLADRMPHYERAAHHIIETTDRRPAEVAAEIAALFENHSP